MGNYLAAYDGAQNRDYKEIGAHGSMDVFLALLLAGYATLNLPDSDRVRQRWLAERRLTAHGVIPARFPHDELGLPHFIEPTRGQMKQLIGFKQDGCMWIALERSTIDRGRKLLPVRCPTLEAFTWIYDHRDEDSSCYAQIRGETVTAFGRAFDLVLPELVESSWYEKLQQLRAVVASIESAADPQLIITG